MDNTYEPNIIYRTMVELRNNIISKLEKMLVGYSRENKILTAENKELKRLLSAQPVIEECEYQIPSAPPAIKKCEYQIPTAQPVIAECEFQIASAPPIAHAEFCKD